MILTACFICMFISGMGAGYALKAILLARQFEESRRCNQLARAEYPCPIAGCNIPGPHTSHLN